MIKVTDARAFYARAHREGFAMLAFDLCNLGMAQGVIDAAGAERAPIILQTYRGSELADGASAVESKLSGALIAQASMPVMLHLDHENGLGLATRCLCRGFSSVMFDGSHLSLEENIAYSLRVSEVARTAIEDEVGRFGGDHGSVYTLIRLQPNPSWLNRVPTRLPCRWVRNTVEVYDDPPSIEHE
jgi:fructose-bisphosphate aldolase, class II